jgi:hypothetical protein
VTVWTPRSGNGSIRSCRMADVTMLFAALVASSEQRTRRGRYEGPCLDSESRLSRRRRFVWMACREGSNRHWLPGLLRAGVTDGSARRSAPVACQPIRRGHYRPTMVPIAADTTMGEADRDSCPLSLVPRLSHAVSISRETGRSNIRICHASGVPSNAGSYWQGCRIARSGGRLRHSLGGDRGCVAIPRSVVVRPFATATDR